MNVIMSELYECHCGVYYELCYYNIGWHWCPLWFVWNVFCTSSTSNHLVLVALVGRGGGGEVGVVRHSIV